MTTWLNVPYSEKDKAKALGCRWDTYYRQWWKPEAVDINNLPIHWHLREGQRWSNNKRGGVVVPKRAR
jgi:hypothetical protein